MDAETLGLLLDELQTLVHDALADPSTSGGPRLWHPLSLLADVTRLSLLTVFESRAETPLERDLAALASRWIGRMGIVHDHELEYATAILLKITGPQFTVLVNNQLRSQDKFARLRAIELSLIRPDTETRTLLAQITQLPGSWDDKQPFPLLQTKAAVALAALGQNRDVTQAILRWGTVLSDLPDMRDGQPPMTDDDLAPALDALRSPDEQVRTNAVFALSVSGRADLAPMIRKLLADVPPESDLARAAVIALDHFGDAHPDVLALLERQLTIPSHAYAAALTLLRDGRPSAIAILTQHLQRSGITPGAGASDFLVANLIRRQETSKTVAQLLWKHIQDGGGHWFGLSPNALESLGDLDTPEVRDFLIQEAYAPESALHIEGRKADAIRGLAKFSKDLAFRAAETALRTDRKDLHLYPDLLIALDEPRAIPLLFTVYSPSLPTLAKWAIGRALRRSAGQPIVQSTLVEMMTADFPESRSSGVELAAWLPPSAFADRIRDIAIRDSSSTVRRSAEKAAALVDRQKSAAELLAAIEGSHGPRCWSYLDALVKLSDPWLLNTGNDPLFIWPRLSEKPPGIRSHAWAQIKKRMDDLKKEAEKSDRDAKD
jgi:HEAT repeat protein